MTAQLAAWEEAVSGHPVTAAPHPDGVLLTIEAFRSTFLATPYDGFEQLTASLAPGFDGWPIEKRDAVSRSLARCHVLTLGARAGVDARGALVVVSDRPDGMAEPLLPWLFRTQIVANAMLSIIASASEAGAPLALPEIRALFARRG